jgi:hypothetical protein
MVVVVADPVFEQRRRPGRLNAPDDALGDQEGERVVHGLKGDGANLDPDDLGHTVGRDVRLPRHRPENSQSLGGDLNTPLPKEVGGGAGHATR